MPVLKGTKEVAHSDQTGNISSIFQVRFNEKNPYSYQRESPRTSVIRDG